MLRLIYICASVVVGLLTSINIGYAVDYRIQRYKINYKIPGNWFVDQLKILKNNDLKTLIQAVGSAHGINPTYIEAAAIVVENMNQDGDRFQSTIKTPEGFTVCKVRLVEAISEGGSGKLAIRVYPWKAHIDVNLQRQHNGSSSWIEYELEVLSIYWRHYRDPDWKPGRDSPTTQRAVNRGLCNYSHDFENPDAPKGAVPIQHGW